MNVEIAEGIEFPDTADGRMWVAGAVIIDDRGNAFAQRRSATRKVFPNCWDVVGGHVEEGESMLQALAREVHEETGWTLSAVVAELGRLDWDPGDGRTRSEIDYLIRVDGDLANPTLEEGKHTEFMWVDESKLDLLIDSRDPGEYFIREIVESGLTAARKLG